MATVMALTAVIFGAEVFVERRIAVDSHIDPAAGIKKKKKVIFFSFFFPFPRSGVKLDHTVNNLRWHSISCITVIFIGTDQQWIERFVPGSRALIDFVIYLVMFSFLSSKKPAHAS